MPSAPTVVTNTVADNRESNTRDEQCTIVQCTPVQTPIPDQFSSQRVVRWSRSVSQLITSCRSNPREKPSEREERLVRGNRGSESSVITAGVRNIIVSPV